jgi:hypothetical protein
MMICWPFWMLFAFLIAGFAARIAFTVVLNLVAIFVRLSPLWMM